MEGCPSAKKKVVNQEREKDPGKISLDTGEW